MNVRLSFSTVVTRKKRAIVMGSGAQIQIIRMDSSLEFTKTAQSVARLFSELRQITSLTANSAGFSKDYTLPVQWPLASQQNDTCSVFVTAILAGPG
jgi:hypothetical protein